MNLHEKIKYFLLMAVVMLSAVTTCGCMNAEGMEARAEKAKREALEYLNASYTDTFTARTYTAGSWAYGYESITFASENYPDEIVEVRIHENEDGTHWFEDDYYQCYMLGDAVRYGESLVADVDTIVKVRFPDYVMSGDLSGAESFGEWKEQGTAVADFFIITRSSLPADTQEEIAKRVASDKIYAGITFLVTGDDSLLQDMPLDELLNNTNEYVVSENVYYINSDFETETD